jgi:beta-1,4-N-acetylglucosaminyltransferase
MKKMLIVCGSGGHTAQGLLLYQELKNNFSCEFLVESNDPLIKKKIKGLKQHSAIPVRGKREPAILVPFRLIICTFQSLVIFIQSRPDVILGTGPGIAVPISVIGKIFGKKVIFLESWSRVTTKSFAGKILYPFVDRFFMQWPEQKKNYKKGIFAGRLG